MTLRPPSNKDQRLRAVREAVGVSQAELARRIGVHRSLVSRAERGLIPTWPRFRRTAAEALGIPESVVFPEPGAPASKPTGAAANVGDGELPERACRIAEGAS